jgi:hypothetical protein
MSDLLKTLRPALVGFGLGCLLLVFFWALIEVMGLRTGFYGVHGPRLYGG